MRGDPMTFLGIILVLTITPGADMALITRAVIRGGRAAIAPTLAGIFSGVAVHVTASITGLSLTIARSPTAFSVVKLAGALYLAWIGVQSLRAWWKLRSQPDAGAPDELPAAPVRARRGLYRDGFMTNILNVKIALFYIALLPQFAPRGDQFLPVAAMLTAIQIAFGFTWLLTLGLLVARAGHAIESSRVRARIEGVAGVTLIALGVRLALVRSS